jgi:hypothetical protein
VVRGIDMLEYQPFYANSYALVMGIDAYKHLAPLSAAVRGAERLASALEEHYAFEVTLLADRRVTRDAVFEWLGAMAHDTGPDDRVLIYFAGHGMTRGSGVYERGYLGLAHSEPGRWHTTLAMDDIIEEARFLKAKHLLYLLDCCFGGMALETRAAVDVPRELDYYLTRPVRYAITAGGKEVVDDALAPGMEQSLFTHHLLEWLVGEHVRPPGGIWRARELGNYLERTVARNRRSGHKPNHNYLPGSGDGDFLFRWESDPRLITEGVSNALCSTNWHVRQGAVAALIDMARGDDAERAAYARDWLARIAGEDADERVRQSAQVFLDEEPPPPPPVTEAPPPAPVAAPPEVQPALRRWWGVILCGLAAALVALRFAVGELELLWIDPISSRRREIVVAAGVLIGVVGVGHLTRRRWLRGVLFLLVAPGWLLFGLYDIYEWYDTWLSWLDYLVWLPFVLTAGALVWSVVDAVRGGEEG